MPLKYWFCKVNLSDFLTCSHFLVALAMVLTDSLLEGFLADAEAPFPWVVNVSGDTRALEEGGGFASLGENVGGSVPDISMGTVASSRCVGPPGSIAMSQTPFAAPGSESAWISLGDLCALFRSSILFLQMSEQWGSLLDSW